MHGSKVFETLYILKCLHSISPLTGGLAGYRILMWTSFSLEVLTSLLYCLLAFNGAIKKSDVFIFVNSLNRIILFPFRNLLGPFYAYYLEISVWFDFWVHLACYIKIFVSWVVYKQQKYISDSSGSSVHDPGSSRFCVWWEPTSWVINSCLLTVFSQVWKAEEALWGPVHYGTDPIHEGSTFMT